MANWVEVKVFASRMEAELAKSVLESVGIESEIRADDQRGLEPALALASGVRLMVMTNDSNKARKILKV